jgi:hypothetical protein
LVNGLVSAAVYFPVANLPSKPDASKIRSIEPHAPLVSAIRADYHASVRACANRNNATTVDAATVDVAIIDADRTTQSTCRFEESAVSNLNGDNDDDKDEDDKDDDNDNNHDDDVVTVGSVSSRASINVVLTNLSA